MHCLDALNIAADKFVCPQNILRINIMDIKQSFVFALLGFG